MLCTLYDRAPLLAKTKEVSIAKYGVAKLRLPGNKQMNIYVCNPVTIKLKVRVFFKKDYVLWRGGRT